MLILKALLWFIPFLKETVFMNRTLHGVIKQNMHFTLVFALLIWIFIMLLFTNAQVYALEQELLKCSVKSNSIPTLSETFLELQNGKR